MRREQIGFRLVLALAVFALALQARAQEIEFDPQEKLEGYTDAYLGKWSDLFDFKDYEERSGEKISKDELARLRTSWSQQCEKIREEIAWYEADSSRMTRIEFKRLMKRHLFFSKIDYREISRRESPYVFFIQRPSKDRKNHYALVEAKLRPWLVAMQKEFDRRFAKPLGWTLPKEKSHFAIAVLSSKGAYNNYGQATGSGSMEGVRGHYTPQDRLVVTYEDAFSYDPEAEREAILTILHEFTHALQQAYYKGEGDVDFPPPLWFDEGMAEYLSEASGNTPDSLSRPALNERRLGDLAFFMRDPKVAATLCLPIAELVAINGTNLEAVRAYLKRGAQIDQAHMMLAAFYAESTMLMHFLNEGAGKRYRPGFMKYADQVMKGKGGLDVFREAMAPATIESIESEFIDHVMRLTAKHLPQLKFDSKPKLVPATSGGGTSVALADTDSIEAPTFSTKGLEPAGIAPEDLLDASLQLARQGDFEGALAFLDSLGERDERLERAHRRLSAVIEVRRDLLETAKGRRRLRIGSEGEEVRGKLVRYDDQTMVLSVDREDVTYPLIWLDAAALLRNARSKMKADNEWMKGYLALLAGKKASDRYLSTAADPQLADDAASIEKEAGDGAAIAALIELAAMTEPKNPAEMRAAASRFTRLVGPNRDASAFTTKKAALRRLGRYLFWHSTDTSDPTKLGLGGKVETLPGDRIRLSYDFQTEAQADDFVKVEYLSELRAGTPLARTRQGLPSSFEVRNGVFEGVGACCYELPLVFKAPMTIRYKGLVQVLDEEPRFIIGFCDDGEGQFIGNVTLGILALSASGNWQAMSGALLQPNHMHSITVHHDGRSTVTVDWGERDKKGDIPCGARLSGRVFIWLHQDSAVKIDDLVIEGGIDKDGFEALRVKQINVRLARLGLE